MDSVSRRSFMKQSAVLAAASAAASGVSPLVSNVTAAASASFSAGVAVRDITPAPGAPLWGYSDGVRVGESTLDSLHAKALVVAAGDTTVGLVVLDLGRVPMPDACARICERAKAAGIEDVVFTATHTHSAPFMELPGLPYLESIENGIAEALEEAKSKVQPAHIGVGRCTIDIAHNRRFIKDGKCYMLWRNAERRPTAPVDQEAGVIRIDTADGKALATLVNYACHSVIFGPDNKQYSADWPGEMCRTVQEATGAECLFLQGGCGDINPYLDKTPLAEGGINAMRGEGRKAGQAVADAWKTIQPAPPGAPSLSYREESVPVGLRWDLQDPQQEAILKEAYGPAFDLYIGRLKPDLAVPLSVLLLNGSLALCLMPGEFFVQLQRDLKTHSPLPDTFLCGYANDFHAYFPTVRDAAIGGYGGNVATYVGVGAGEKLVTRAAVLVGEMTGQLGKLKGPEDLALLEMT